MWFELDDYESRYAARISFKYTGAQETRLVARWKNSGVLAQHATVHVARCNLFFFYVFHPEMFDTHTINNNVQSNTTII